VVRQSQENFDLTEGNTYFLEPGYIYFSKQETSVLTVLGSCVAVCLWDKNLKYGGMNHFLHPQTCDPQKATPKYGNVAIIALVRMMEEASCKRSDMVAQVFGGASPEHSNGHDIGEDNVRVARNMLASKGINIISEDTGGSMGRKIIFNIETGQAAVLKVHRIRESDWARQ
jgi:chemotaxis protein CheD